ncbi:S41 family peptidase [Nafulsella turpanensis]|uniref:S41 family peptidase n=1 Tax=Nafulsella turpanensis TaxID=1265690 RepID=UPI00034D81FD|nr:S41 family peptidase [Nafulsella turpanensis]
MKHPIRKLLLLLMAAPLLSHAQSTDIYFTLDPVLTPDAGSIIFNYEGDLWQVPVTGGSALRLTAMEGEESRPSVSPDGQWLAFTSEQYGNKDVFVMPLQGGEVVQLTFHEATDEVESWSWDSREIYFTSDRYNRYSGYHVGREGGTPKRLFDHYFNTVHNIAIHPATQEVYFNESWESKSFAHRKRYKGDYNPNIKTYNPLSGEYRELTSYRGKDFGATIDKNGRVYFKSDEANGEYNLYTFENSQKKQLTSFPSSIMWPKVSANGEKVVFRKDYQIYVYDVASGQTTKPDIRVFKNSSLDRQQTFNVKSDIASFDLSPDQKKIAFVSRGELFITDPKGKFVQQIFTTPNKAVGEVKWLSDNRTLLFTQTAGGYYNWFTIAADGSAPEKQITFDQQNNRQLTFNSDRSQAVYLSGRNEVRIMDLENFKSNTIARDELWGFYNSNPYFSPDDEYVTYTAHRHFENDIFVYHIDSKESFNLTHTRVNEGQPYWSPDGKYLYFSSDRINPGYPYGTKNAKIYRMALDKYDAPFRSDKVSELFSEKNSEGAKESDKKKKEKDAAPEKPELSINHSGLMERLEQISPSFGQQFAPYVVQEGDKTMVFYLSDHKEGNSHLYKTSLEPFEEAKTEQIGEEEVHSYQIAKAGDSFFILANGSIYTLDNKNNKVEALPVSHTFSKTLSHEFEQMFYEAWAGMEENFYDENFHGQDWQGLRDRYAAYIPHISRREHLRLLLNDMMGELNTSHFGFRSSGAEEETYYGTRSIATGILFSNEAPYTVSRIVKQSPADVKEKDILPGDRLVAVNGIAVHPSVNREKYFSAPSLSDEVSLTFERNGKQKEVKLHTTTYGSLSDLLYDEWQDANQEYVNQQAGNRIAYVHMKNMGGGELEQFMHDMVSEAAYRDGLILDLRYNTGGNVHDDVLRFLSQKPYLQWKYREGALTSQSNFGPSVKPIVLLINEQSLSDAEMTANGFKELGLGTVVGTETYRWIIFTTGESLVDGSFYRLPSWGCYTLDGRNLETEGVSPDVYVGKNFKDRLSHRQPQLDKAIEIILKDLNKEE